MFHTIEFKKFHPRFTNSLCDEYARNGNQVFPHDMMEGVFTTAAIDNIDHNPSSSTAVDSLHGSSVTIIQHLDSSLVSVPSHHPLDMENVVWTMKVSSKLPDSYTIPPVTGNLVCEVPISTVNFQYAEHSGSTVASLQPWLNEVVETLQKKEQKNVSFAAYQSRQTEEAFSISKCHQRQLPLLKDEIQSPSTIRHLMNVITSIIKRVDSTQAPVITADQPVYALGKYLQWKHPTIYGEDQIVFMMGGLHIEMAVQNAVGKWLMGSGWTDILVKAGVLRLADASPFLKHRMSSELVTRTK